jgi:hypothetical protein
MRLVVLIIAAMCFVSCQPEVSSDSVTEQENRVKKAAFEFKIEKAKLQSLKDNLHVRIEENVKLGMSEEKASSVEKALIQVQETVVKASELHMIQQQEVLALIKSSQF